MDYPVESFSDEERAAPRPALHEPRPAGLRAREPAGDGQGRACSRATRATGGTLRRLFLDEFAGDLDAGAAAAFDGDEGERARRLYERIFLGYGDDSVAQLGGAHIACEWVSNVMTKLLQRGRLAAYLEQSTRYIAYDAPMPEAAATATGATPRSAPSTRRPWTSLFDTYAESLPRVMAWAEERFPRAAGEPEAAHQRSIKAKALDLLRGLLPAASLSHMGIFATGQAYEQLLLRLFASPLPRRATTPT